MPVNVRVSRKMQCCSTVDCAHNHPALAHSHGSFVLPSSLPVVLARIHSHALSPTPTITLFFARGVEVARGSLTALDVGAGIGRVTKHVLIPAGFGKARACRACLRLLQSHSTTFAPGHSRCNRLSYLPPPSALLLDRVSVPCGFCLNLQVVPLLPPIEIIRPNARFSRVA